MSDETITLRTALGEESLIVHELQIVAERQGVVVERRTLGLFPLTLGSGSDCGWVVADDAVSRRHVELRLSGAGVKVRDLGSKNGTWIDGIRAIEAVVPVGAAFSIGGTTLRILSSERTSEFPLSARTSFGEAVGGSPLMRALFAALERVAKTENATLILGETGTGKELLAHGIHALGSRKDKPFVVFDCAATAPSLIEGELFGYVKGAFTGADKPRKGLLEEAHTGTLFLDEVAELPLESQAKLLRALETKTFRPLGSSDERQADVRVIAATCRDLKTRVAAQKFRSDLYFRLAVIVAEVPPLRDRKEDIPLIVERLLTRLQPPVPMSAFPSSLMTLLQSHHWPGNVRELSNAVHRLALFPNLGARAFESTRPPPADSDEGAGLKVGAEHFGLPLREARAAVVQEFEISYLQTKLRENGGSVAATARAIGVSRQFLYRLLDQYAFSEFDRE